VAGFTAYFDASGDAARGPILVVSGFLASAKAWRTFERAWAQALRQEGVTYFHMKEFAHSVGEFTTWKGDELRRKRLITTLINIIARTAICSFAAGVPVTEWKECNDLYTLDQCKFQPYPLCGWACTEQVYRWCDATRVDQSHVSFVFENGDRYQGNLRTLVNRDFGSVFATEEKKTFGALQATDFAAWQVRNVLQKHHENVLNRFRKDFEALFSRVERAPSLIRFCNDHQIPKRQ
jgi:hypothetical protein